MIDPPFQEFDGVSAAPDGIEKPLGFGADETYTCSVAMIRA
jgi:hypothetical protein